MINISVLTLLPIVFGVINYDKLPSELAASINLYTNGFNYLSKPFVLILIPVIFTVLNLFLDTCKLRGDKKYNIWVIPLVTNIFLIIIISNTIRLQSPLYFSILFLAGLIISFLGINLITDEYIKIKKYFEKFSIRESNLKRIGYIYILGSYLFIILSYLNINIIFLISMLVFIVVLLPVLVNQFMKKK